VNIPAHEPFGIPDWGHSMAWESKQWLIFTLRVDNWLLTINVWMTSLNKLFLLYVFFFNQQFRGTLLLMIFDLLISICIHWPWKSPTISKIGEKPSSKKWWNSESPSHFQTGVVGLPGWKVSMNFVAWKMVERLKMYLVF